MPEEASAAATIQRLEGALQQCLQQKESCEQTVRLLTVIAASLDATSTDMPVPLPLASSPLLADETLPLLHLTNNRVVSTALGAVLYSMAKIQHAAGAAVLRLSSRIECVNASVQHLTASVVSGTKAIQHSLEVGRRKALLDAATLAVLTTLVRLGCSESEENQVKPLPSCVAVLQRAWLAREMDTSAALTESVEVHQSAICTTCALLRSNLFETLTTQRFFPSVHVWGQLRAIRAAWVREVSPTGIHHRP
ncbi:hypothetical protein ERJ75_000038000 [Trypanosoma vivax]|uniref:Uncharacterized protein n=1 Tax=Trypanosoma vivax (strain Y486) TaxID=1055687 RepID=G0U7L8_TRYVY|nr:hypothetical protein TRVL_01470 [Trypanosoma vivax]KAH8620401.1 hypothetical protein ERJ75_000038000 [Trypanosoma vivax]CCC51876.1 conserved hypothetical protein [Trypanosoma vivax Y486]